MNSPGKELPEEPNLRTSRSRPGAVSSWVWNIRAKPHVRLRIKGGSFAGVAHEIIGPAEIDVARSVLCERCIRPIMPRPASIFADSRHGRKSKDCIGIGSTPDIHWWSNSEASRLRGLPSDCGSQARSELTHAAPTTPRQRSAPITRRQCATTVALPIYSARRLSWSVAAVSRFVGQPGCAGVRQRSGCTWTTYFDKPWRHAEVLLI